MFRIFPGISLRSLAKNIGTLTRVEGSALIHEAKDWLTRTRIALKDIAGTNLRLGHTHLLQGNLEDAWIRFRFYTWLRPDNAEGWYFFGRSCARLSDKKNALKYLGKSLELRPNHKLSQYFLAALVTPELLPRIPEEVLCEYSDALAQGLTTRWLSVTAPAVQQLADATARAWPLSSKPERILELSAYGNTLASLLRNKGLGRHYTGVASSPKQQEAQEKETFQGMCVYDQVIAMDALSFLENTRDTFDGIVSLDACVVHADPTPLFKAVAKKLSADGVFAFLLLTPNKVFTAPNEKVEKTIVSALSLKSDTDALLSMIIPSHASPSASFAPTLDGFLHTPKMLLDALSSCGLLLAHHRFLEGPQGLEACLVVARRA